MNEQLIEALKDIRSAITGLQIAVNIMTVGIVIALVMLKLK